MAVPALARVEPTATVAAVADTETQPLRGPPELDARPLPLHPALPLGRVPDITCEACWSGGDVLKEQHAISRACVSHISELRHRSLQVIVVHRASLIRLRSANKLGTVEL